MMLENGTTPIMKKIMSMKNLSSSQRGRLNWLKEVFRKEGRIPLGTSTQEMKYLFRLETGRRRYRRSRHLSFINNEAPPQETPWDCNIEEALALLSRERNEQNEVPEK